MSSLRTTCTLFRSTWLLTSHQVNLSRSAVVFSDIQVKDKPKEAKKLEINKPVETMGVAKRAYMPMMHISPIQVIMIQLMDQITQTVVMFLRRMV